MPNQYVSFSAAWFTLSLINAGLAQGKGRSGFTWWVLSLFLGPFATLLIVVWPVVQPGSQEGRMTRTQAVVIGAIVLVVMFGLIGLASVGGLGQGS